VPEELLQFFAIKGWRDGKLVVVMEAAVCHENMAVRYLLNNSRYFVEMGKK